MKSVPELFERVVTRHPERIAVKTMEKQATYRELGCRSDAIAGTILEELGPESKPVMLFSDKDPVDSIAAVLGILKAGKFYIYINPTHSGVLLGRIIRETGTELVITDNEAAKTASIHCDENVRPIRLDEIESGARREKVEIPISPKSLACIYFTSGSTGNPKGAIWDHEGWNIRRGIAKFDNVRTPMLLNYGISHAVRGLLNGITLYPYNIGADRPESLLDWFEREKITNFGPPVSLFRRIVALMPEGKWFTTLRILALTGQTVSREDVENFRKFFPENCVLNHVLSSIETYVISLLGINRQTVIEGNTVPVGYAPKGKEVFLVDDSGRKVPAGVPGEIAVRSRFLALGYWNDPEMTRKKFLPDPEGGDERIFLTGDLGVMDRNGCLTFIGRKDFQTKIRGFRVETEAVDRALLSLGLLREAVVSTQVSASRENNLIGYVVPKRLPPPTVSELRSGLQETLPEYMIPSRFVFLESLPRLANLKVDRKRLPDPDMTRPSVGRTFVAPRSRLEKTLTEIWTEVLNIEDIGIRDNFFDLGGNSILAVRLVREIEKRTGSVLPLKALFKISTVEQMARSMEQEPVCCEPQPIGRDDDGQPSGRGLSEKDYRLLLAVVSGSKQKSVNNGSLVIEVNANHRKRLIFPRKRHIFWCFNSVEPELQNLSEYLGKRQPLYGFLSGVRLLRNRTKGKMEALASYYVKEILKIDPKGPYLLGGNCTGALISCNIAFQLLALGKKIDRLCFLEFFDPRLFDYPDKMMLIYGKDSHLKAYEPFGWGRPGWEKAFQAAPRVEWIPGAHGQYFREPNIRMLKALLNDFLFH